MRALIEKLRLLEISAIWRAANRGLKVARAASRYASDSVRYLICEAPQPRGPSHDQDRAFRGRGARIIFHRGIRGPELGAAGPGARDGRDPAMHAPHRN